MGSTGVTGELADGQEEEDRSSNFSPPTPDISIHVHGVTFHLNKRCMASRSVKFAQLLSTPHHPPITTYTFTDMPTDSKTFKLAAEFCHGQAPRLTSSTVAPLACLAGFLEMTEEHSPDNLLEQSLAFMFNKVLPYWNDTIKAYKSIEPLLECARKLGLLHALLDSIAQKVVADPCLLMNPMEGHDRSNSGAKRRLFLAEWCAEDLTGLNLQMFVMAVLAVAHAGVKEDHVAQCLYRYVKKRAPAPETDDGVSLVYRKNRQREVIEAVEKLLPTKKGSLHVKCLFEMLRSAIYLQASVDCRNGLEARIAQQLPEANVDDLLLPSHGYATETMHDFECVRRILNYFCSSNYSNKNSNDDAAELEAVSELVEDFLPVAAKDPGLKKETFTSLLGMLVAMLHQIGRTHDKVYHAVDVYLQAHGHMTESEREEVCRVLDARRMSMAACEHATLNEQMPMRTVAQVLFMGHLRMKEVIAEAMIDLEGVSLNDKEEKEKEKEKETEVVAMAVHGGRSGEMENRVMRLEEECGRMREEIKRCRGCDGSAKKRKRGFWTEMKWKLGCSRSAMQDCNCHVKKRKVHPTDNSGP